jgi:ubiquinone/menaquinone biosynthesis C-methylase UbiE
MSVKDHYNNHLASFYSWMAGDFNSQKNQFKNLIRDHIALPVNGNNAIDLGAGHGIQSIALSELGFNITAIDFNNQLLQELEDNKGQVLIDTVFDDIRNITDYKHLNPRLVVCCGDTISHLESEQEIADLVKSIREILTNDGKVVLTFRDYSEELTGSQRFIPVKNDTERILTCFLEYTEKKVRVTDLLYEREGDSWNQKISSYDKVRISQGKVTGILKENGFRLLSEGNTAGMVALIAEKT